MKINPDIFRAYDIRGAYPDEINEEIACKIGKAFTLFIKRKQKKNNLNIVIGRDGRLSSPKIYKALARGIIDQGANIIDIGLSTTPMLYWTAARFNFDGGINITGSHLSASHNGLKMVRGGAIPVSGESGIETIRDMVIRDDFKSEKKGKITKKDILKEYVNFNLNKVNFKKIEPLKIVIDTANTVSGIIIPELFKGTKHSVYHLCSEIDGNFPNHDPNPLIKENINNLIEVIKKEGADIGICFDGDGDRIVFVDEKGDPVSGDLITALVGTFILKKSPHKKILFDVRSSNVVKETIDKNNGLPVIWKIGHSLIKEKMRKDNIFFAGELSAHYFHKEHYFSECPIFVLGAVLEIISQKKTVLSEIVKPYKKYFCSGEVNFRVKNKEEILINLEREFKEGNIFKIDGLRINFDDWWFLVRPSNTESLLRLVVEGKTEKLMKEKKKELIALIKKFSK